MTETTELLRKCRDEIVKSLKDDVAASVAKSPAGVTDDRPHVYPLASLFLGSMMIVNEYPLKPSDPGYGHSKCGVKLTHRITEEALIGLIDDVAAYHAKHTGLPADDPLVALVAEIFVAGEVSGFLGAKSRKDRAFASVVTV